MNSLEFVLFSIVFILVLTAMILLKDKVLVFNWEQGLKIYFEDKEDRDEVQ